MYPIGALFVPLLFQLPEAAREEGARDRALAIGKRYVEESRQTIQRDDYDLEHEQPALEARRVAVEAELATLGEHPWAGWYYEGNGLGHNVRLGIAPSAGALYTLHGCMGLYDLNHGEIRAAGTQGIELSLALDPARNHQVFRTAVARPTISSRWVPVRWDDQRFLIPECQLIAFCNEVNSGGDARSFPRRQAAADRLVRRVRPGGLPELPPDYAPFLLAHALEAELENTSTPRVIGTFADGSTEKFLVSAEIALGLEQGLLPGMVLHAPADGRGEGEVVEVEQTRARLEFRFANYSSRDVPRKGWPVTTRKPARIRR